MSCLVLFGSILSRCVIFISMGLFLLIGLTLSWFAWFYSVLFWTVACTHVSVVGLEQFSARVSCWDLSTASVAGSSWWGAIPAGDQGLDNYNQHKLWFDACGVQAFQFAVCVIHFLKAVKD